MFRCMTLSFVNPPFSLLPYQGKVDLFKSMQIFYHQELMKSYVHPKLICQDEFSSVLCVFSAEVTAQS